MKKIIFTFNVDNIISLITNSSSELFVLQGNTKESVEEMIESVYPDYLSEYEYLKDLREMSNEEIDSFLWWHLGRSSNWWSSGTLYTNPSEYIQLEGFEFDEVYDTTVELGHGVGQRNEYQIKNNIPLEERKSDWDSSFVIDSNRERVINALEKAVGRFFLYARDENPDWERQEDLMSIGTRYHLG